MSNSREIMNKRLLMTAIALTSITETVTYSIKAIDMFNAASSDLRIGNQLQSFTPPHKKSRRSKFKRSGK